jgi:hypothetical protein
MQSNTEEFIEFDEPARTSPKIICQTNIERAKHALLRLRTLLSQPLSTRQELTVCTYYLAELENLGIDIRSEAWDDKMYWQKIWKKRIQAQNAIDQWMVRHQPGTPIY